MTERVKPERRRHLLGLGALACLGCCAAPVLAVLGGLSVAGLAATTVLGGAGLVIAVGAAVAYLSVRTRRARACAVAPFDAVPVTAPSRRGTNTSTEEVPVP
jgi:hypothetical protein